MNYSQIFIYIAKIKKNIKCEDWQSKNFNTAVPQKSLIPQFLKKINFRSKSSLKSKYFG